MKANVKKILKAFLRDDPHRSDEQWKTVSLGDGLWGIEYYLSNSFVCEWVGSNGTREPSDDLHSISAAQYQAALALYRRIRGVPQPEFLGGARGNRG